MHLLTPTGYSHKIELGLASGIGEAILYLSPAFEAYPDHSRNMCPGHSPECFTFCLIHSGQMIMPHAKAARIRRTHLLVDDPEAFGRDLVRDVDAQVRWARRRNLLPAFRFNGTSDFNWETFVVPHLGETVHRYLERVAPDAMVNEYTKRFGVMRRWVAGEYPKNLHMTFSLHELNEHQARTILDEGGNVAVVFRVKKGHPLPERWFGHPVLDGDVDDLRWLDNERARFLGHRPPLVIGLRNKGTLARTVSPFSVDPYEHTHLEVAA